MGATALATIFGAFAIGGAGGAHAHAQMPDKEIAAIVRTYAIPAGSMSHALNRLADASGVLLVYDTELTSDLTTRGLEGTHTLNVALRKLLSGTGLGYEVAADGKSVLIVLAQNDTGARSDASGAEALPTIDIGADTAQARGRPGNGGRGAGDPSKETGYTRSTSFSATKSSTPLIDAPVAVQIVPHEVIADKQALNTMEAVKNVSGVQASVGTYYDQYLIRGFKSGYGVTWRNGLQLEGLTGAEDILFTDRVEIVKGPASVLYGRIEPGGFVNVVTKRPQEEFKAEVNEQAGSWGLSRTTFDMTGAVDAEKTVLYRLMGVYDHADSFVDFEHRDNGAAALFLTFRPTSNFEFNTQFEHYQKKQTSPDGLGTIPVTRFQGFYNTPYALPRHFSAGDPGVWNDFPFVVHRTVFAYDWTYKFDEDWKLTNRFHYVINDENQTGFWGTGMSGDGAGIDRAFYNYLFQRRQISTNLDLSGAFETGPLKHKSLVGVDWWTSQADEFGLDSWGSEPLTLNVFAPSYGNITGYLRYLVDNARANALYRHRRRDFGVYVQDHVSFFDDRVHLLLGGRWDKAEFNGSQIYGEWDSSCFPTCTAYPLDHAADKPKISPRAGILFKIDEDTSVYGSYVRSFGANNGAAKDGTIFPPEVGLQWEIGAKKLWLDGRVMTSLTFFDLTKMNVMQPDPTAPGFSRAAGTVKSRGIELDFSGQVTDNLSLIASYTFDSAKIVNDLGNGTAGNRFNSVAPNVGSLWAKWDTAPKASEGFEFGGGVYAMDERWGDNANSWRLPGYVKLDAMGAYRTLIDGHAVKFQLNIKNLTDKRYFEYSDGYGFAYYGMPRTFIGSVNFQF